MKITRRHIDMLAAAIAEAEATDRPADTLLHLFFRANPQLGAGDRALVADGLFGWLRRRRSMEALAETRHPPLLALAVLVRELGHSVRELGPHLSGRETAWLEEFKGRKPEMSPAVAHDVPDWLWDRLGAFMTEEERSATVRAWLKPAPLDIRINPMRAKREDIRETLAAEGIPAEPTPYSPLGLRIAGRPALNRTAAFISGDVEVQDEGSQLLGLMVQPKRNEMVVDFCAGAGGKTLLMGALMRNQGRLYAFDTSEKRLANLKPRLARSGLSNVNPQVITHENDARIKRLAGKIDRVLVDAPCSGLGTVRRNPDLKWRVTPQTVAELGAKQRAILAAAAKLVKPGGRLVYATCSVLPEENRDVVDAFLKDNSGFRLVPAGEVIARLEIPLQAGEYLELAPHREGCDGFFAAVLERAAS